MKKYPSIGQFRQAVRTVKTNHDYKGKDENGETVYRHDSPYPVLRFTGTVKCHGTNSAVVKYSDGRTEYQSRELLISVEKDNAGFCMAMKGKNLEKFFSSIDFREYCAVYGEWCR